MKLLRVFLIFLLISCESNERKSFSSVEIDVILQDSISVRAIEIMGENLAFAADKGKYGLYDVQNDVVRTNVQQYDSITPEFRAVASTSNDFFMLSVGNPALLYKTGDTGSMELVYKEEDENVFYDSMTFWNDREGIAMGDPTGNCLSIIITRDGGETWSKISCDNFPEVGEGEAAFAASNSNIAVSGDNTWILSGGMRSRVFYSPDKGMNWEVYDTPLVQGTATTGGYSIDFYDDKTGIIIGGDYTNPTANEANKAITKDGGRTWSLISDGNEPGYMSSIRFIPNRDGQEIIALGISGIFYSSNEGQSWSKLSEEGFYTIRFLDEFTAYAAGRNRIALLRFQ